MESVDRNQTSIESINQPGDMSYMSGAAADSPRSLELLDMEAVQRLQSLNSEKDPDFFSHLVEAFLSFGQKNISQLNEALPQQDWAAIGRYAHAIKGSCANFGALNAVSLCREIEQEIAAQHWDSVPKLAARMTHEFKLITHLLNSISATTSVSPSH